MPTPFKLLWVWGMADGLWLALYPAAWSRFWGRTLTAIARRHVLARSLGVAEFALSLYLLRRSEQRRTRAGATARAAHG